MQSESWGAAPPDIQADDLMELCRLCRRASLRDDPILGHFHLVHTAKREEKLHRVETDGGHRISACPEMLARKVPLIPTHACDGNGALPFQKTDHRGDRMLRGYGNTHVHMVRHEMPFENLAFLLLGKGVEYGSQLSA